MLAPYLCNRFLNEAIGRYASRDHLHKILSGVFNNNLFSIKLLSYLCHPLFETADYRNLPGLELCKKNDKAEKKLWMESKIPRIFALR